ncbi:hypothetical protein FJT64_017758 [Amphibalanus amphitrite]|uniref:Uncharacterized protein n=1 Tax=Amphibalanus amphitrite TaxID=1232801 RepID=A0A6A4X1U0_AMPAM|nr:hypothetical protein FJT64_017758 [Amphibalanus amphitrite]
MEHLREPLSSALPLQPELLLGVRLPPTQPLKLTCDNPAEHIICAQCNIGGPLPVPPSPNTPTPDGLCRRSGHIPIINRICNASTAAGG